MKKLQWWPVLSLVVLASAVNIAKVPTWDHNDNFRSPATELQDKPSESHDLNDQIESNDNSSRKEKGTISKEKIETSISQEEIRAEKEEFKKDCDNSEDKMAKLEKEIKELLADKAEIADELLGFKKKMKKAKKYLADIVDYLDRDTNNSRSFPYTTHSSYYPQKMDSFAQMDMFRSPLLNPTQRDFEEYMSYAHFQRMGRFIDRRNSFRPEFDRYGTIVNNYYGVQSGSSIYSGAGDLYGLFNDASQIQPQDHQYTMGRNRGFNFTQSTGAEINGNLYPEQLPSIDVPRSPAGNNRPFQII